MSSDGSLHEHRTALPAHLAAIIRRRAAAQDDRLLLGLLQHDERDRAPTHVGDPPRDRVVGERRRHEDVRRVARAGARDLRTDLIADLMSPVTIDEALAVSR